MQGAPYIAAVESTGQHFDTVAQDNGYPVTKPIDECSVVDVDDLDGVATTFCDSGDDRIRLLAQRTRLSSQKQQVAHCGTVRLVRPGTTIAILILIGLLLVVGVIFVVRLNSVT